MTRLRWKLWEWSDWLSYLICPDRAALIFIKRHGYERVRAALSESREDGGGE